MRRLKNSKKWPPSVYQGRIYEKQPLPLRGKMAAVFYKPIKHLLRCLLFLFCRGGRIVIGRNGFVGVNFDTI
jgi:hypothetical protein